MSIEEEIRQLQEKATNRSRKSRSERTGQTASASAWIIELRSEAGRRDYPTPALLGVTAPLFCRQKKDCGNEGCTIDLYIDTERTLTRKTIEGMGVQMARNASKGS